MPSYPISTTTTTTTITTSDNNNNNNTDDKEEENSFSKRMKSVLRNLDVTLQDQDDTRKVRGNNNTTGNAVDTTTPTTTTDTVPKKKQKSFGELQEEMMALLEQQQPFHYSSTGTTTTDPTKATKSANKCWNYNHHLRNTNTTTTTTTTTNPNNKSLVQPQKKVHWEEEPILSTPPRVHTIVPEDAVKTVFGPTIFSPAEQLLLPLEWDGTTTTATTTTTSSTTTLPPTSSPLLSSHRRNKNQLKKALSITPTIQNNNPNNLGSTSNTIIQRPHTAPAKPTAAATTTTTLYTAIKQSPVDELKNRLRIYTTSRNHRRIRYQNNTTATSTDTTEEGKNNPPDLVPNINSITTTSIKSNDTPAAVSGRKQRVQGITSHGTNGIIPKVSTTTTTTTSNNNTNENASTTYRGNNSYSIPNNNNYDTPTIQGSLLPIDNLSYHTSPTEDQQQRYQEELITQYKLEIDNLNKVNMYQKAQIINYETTIKEMELRRKDQSYEIDTKTRRNNNSNKQVSSLVLTSSTKSAVINNDEPVPNSNRFFKTVAFQNELRQIIKWRQRAIHAESKLHDWKRREEDLWSKYNKLQQQYERSLHTIRSLEEENSTAYNEFQKKYEESCQQIKFLKEELTVKKSSYRLAAEAALKQLLLTNNHNNRKTPYDKNRSCSLDQEALQASYDVLQTQFEQAIELIYFLEEELEIEKMKKKFNDRNHVSDDDNLGVLLLPSNGVSNHHTSASTLGQECSEEAIESLTGLPLLTEVVNTLKRMILIKSNNQSNDNLFASQHASVQAALDRLKEYQCSETAKTEEEDDVGNDCSSDNLQRGNVVSEDDGRLDVFSFEDNMDEEKNQSHDDYIRNLNLDFVKEDEEGEAAILRNDDMVTSSDDDVFLNNDYGDFPTSTALAVHHDYVPMSKITSQAAATTSIDDGVDDNYEDWAIHALSRKCSLLESERDKIVNEALDLVNVTKREAEASAEARIAVIRFAYTQQLNRQEAKSQRLIIEMESRYHQKLLQVLEKKNATVLKLKLFMTWRLRVSATKPQFASSSPTVTQL